MPFYKTTIVVEVLSDGPYEYNNLKWTHYDIIEGECSGYVRVQSQEELNADDLIAECDKHATDPEFFLGHLDFDRFPPDELEPSSKYPAWVEELYDGWAVDELVDEYLKVLIADLSDDVDCSPSTTIGRAHRISYLADQLPEELADALERAALEIVKYIGYASGTPWEEGQDDR